MKDISFDKKSWAYVDLEELSTIRPKDRLEGTSSFNAWKRRVLNIIEEHDLDGYFSNVVEDPTFNARCIHFKKNQDKSKRIIYDSMKYNLMSVITLLKTAKECFGTMTNIYEKKESSPKRSLKNTLWTIKMEKDETMSSFFTKSSQVRDKIASIGVMVDEDDLLQTSIDGLTSS